MESVVYDNKLREHILTNKILSNESLVLTMKEWCFMLDTECIRYITSVSEFKSNQTTHSN